MRRLQLANICGDYGVGQEPLGLAVHRFELANTPRKLPVIWTVMGPLRSCLCAVWSPRILRVILGLSSRAVDGGFLHFRCVVGLPWTSLALAVSITACSSRILVAILLLSSSALALVLMAIAPSAAPGILG